MRKHNQGELDWVPRTTFTIPYIPGISKEIRRVCRDFDIRVAFKTGMTMHPELTRVKDTLPLEKQAMVIYRVPCSCGLVYIGKTIRRLESRLKEHKDVCSQGQLEKSAIAEHAWRHNHRIDWSNTGVIAQVSKHKELLKKETLHIRVTTGKGSLNRDRGVELHDCWMAALRCEQLGQDC